MLDTTRLNERIRKDIARAALQYAFGPRVKSLNREGRRLAAQAYDELFTMTDQAIVNNLPAGWMPEQESITVRVGGQQHVLAFNGEVSWPYDLMYRHHMRHLENEGSRIGRRVPFADKAVEIPVHSEFGKDIERFVQAIQSVSDDFKPAFNAIDKALKTYNTVRTLKAAWPEVEPFLPLSDTPKPSGAPVPAISVPTLNMLFKLPVPKDGDNVVTLDGKTA